MFGLIAISRPKKSFEISNQCIIKTAMKLFLLATIKLLFLLSIVNVYYLYLKIAMVVKSIFLILNISHSSFANNHNISDLLQLGEGGDGGGGPTWPLVSLGPSLVTAQYHPCHQENKSQQHYPNKYSPDLLQFYVLRQSIHTI